MVDFGLVLLVGALLKDALVFHVSPSEGTLPGAFNTLNPSSFQHLHVVLFLLQLSAAAACGLTRNIILDFQCCWPVWSHLASNDFIQHA